jgi:X-X-X-Leu-X-X-Gly heptad repeat protein
MSLNQLQTGVQQVADGANPVARSGKTGETIVSELQGPYYENAYRGNVFVAAQTAATAAIATAAGGATLVLFNPSNNTKNLVILDVTVCLETETGQTAKVAFQLAGAATGTTQTLTTPLTGLSSIVGGSNKPSGVTLVSSTFSNAAVPLRYLGALSQAATNTTGVTGVVSFKDEVKGAIIVPPGSYVGIYGLTAWTIGDASIVASMTWAEVNAL